MYIFINSCTLHYIFVNLSVCIKFFPRSFNLCFIISLATAPGRSGRTFGSVSTGIKRFQSKTQYGMEGLETFNIIMIIHIYIYKYTIDMYTFA